MTTSDPEPVEITRAPRVMVNPREASEILGMSRRVFDERVRDGIIPGPIFVRGKSRLWAVQELIHWAAHHCPPADDWSSLWPTIRDRQVG